MVGGFSSFHPSVQPLTHSLGVVINMSLGGSKSQAVNDAVASAVDAGKSFVASFHALTNVF
jgi:subtilisin family serine protease